MLNQVVMVGRIVEIIPEVNEIVLKIPRSYKNEQGKYDEDLIPVSLLTNIMNNTKEYCKTNDIVGIKGRLESKDMRLVVMAEKITFLASKDNEGGE